MAKARTTTTARKQTGTKHQILAAIMEGKKEARSQKSDGSDLGFSSWGLLMDTPLVCLCERNYQFILKGNSYRFQIYLCVTSLWASTCSVIYPIEPRAKLPAKIWASTDAMGP